MHTEKRHAGHHYIHLAIMIALSYLVMFGFMYAMVDRLGYVYANLNQAYMAALMAAPMLIIELIVMRGMYANKSLNVILIVLGVAVTLAAWFMIRYQTAIGDAQFLRSMIPHHSGAILMCREAPITKPDLKALCQQIIKSQQEEIDQMQRMLAGSR